MEKVKLNNQIVSMRKYVKQAKVHVINKLVKQIKFLQNRKGNETQVQKAKRKAERFLEAVAIVKKIKPDEVSKLALSKAKAWKDVLQQKNSSLHDRCIAMLTTYSAVEKEVEAFYCANKELVLKITDYIAQWEEKNKLSKDSPNISKMSSMKKSNKVNEANLKSLIAANNNTNKLKADLKAKSNSHKSDAVFKVSHSNENVDLESENSDNNTDNEEKLATIHKSLNRNPVKITNEIEDLCSDEKDSIKAEESDNNGEESESDENNEQEEGNGSSLDNNNEVEDSGDEKNHSNKTYKSESKSDSLLKIGNTKNKLKAIALINLNELEGLEEIPVISNSFENDTSNEKESSEDEVSEVSQNKSSDPFFLGHNNEDFNPKEVDDPFDDFRTKDSAHSFNHETQSKKVFFHKKDDQFNHKRKFQKSPYNYNVSKRFKGGENGENLFKKDKFGSRNYHNKFQEKNIHKNRDFKPKNKPFFPRDAHDKKQFKNDSKSYGKKEDGVSMKNKVSYKKGSTNESLHPSWEAKRKQKELLGTSFQGKRMIFDD